MLQLHVQQRVVRACMGIYENMLICMHECVWHSSIHKIQIVTNLRMLQKRKIQNHATKISDVTENRNFVAQSIRCAYVCVCVLVVANKYACIQADATRKQKLLIFQK